MNEPVRAKDVQIQRVSSFTGPRMHQAVCMRRPCVWQGALHATYQEANVERQAHLDEHREQASAP